MITALVTLPAGAIAIGILLVDEVDEAFANVYSTTMSVQNLFPRLDRRIVAVTIGVLATLLAGLLDFGQYQSFLFLIGSVFVPLFAVAAVDFFAVSGQRWDVSRPRPAAGGAGDRLGLRLRRVPARLPGHRARLGGLLDRRRRVRSASPRRRGSAPRSRRSSSADWSCSWPGDWRPRAQLPNRS